MKFAKKLVRSFVLRSDMFAAQPTLRFNGESSYQTMCGGCVSIILVVTFIVIFSRSFVDVINKVNVTASLNLEDNPYQTSEISGIGLAVGISGLDFSDSQRYLNIILKVKNTALGGSSTQTQIELSTCDIEDWQDYGEHFSKLFSVYGMSKMLCPTDSSSLILKGFEGSSEWVTMSILVEQCRNRTGESWTCHTPADITAAFNTYLTTRDFLKVSLLILNTVISPQQQDPTKNVLENQIFVTFSNTSGSRSDIKLGRYTITTDNSIWPMSDETTEQGYYITSHDTYSINLYSTHYVRIEIEKARTVYEITRSHDKLDEMLSYVGGLFALIFGWLLFFFASYNQYKYEIAVAEHTFSMDGTGRKVRQEKFGFFTYLKYCLFDWIKTFGLCISWPAMEQLDSARDEACEQMDIRYLMKKIQRYQIINKFLMGEHNVIMANLSRPPTLQQVKKMRKITQYYDKVIKAQNEENLLKSILKVSQEGNKRQIFDEGREEDEKTINKAEENTDLDSQDQEIEKEIAEIYREKKLKDLAQSELTQKILEEMPQSMKDRLKNLKLAENTNQNLVDKEKVRIQSSFSIGQNAPNFFLSSLNEYKQQK